MREMLWRGLTRLILTLAAASAIAADPTGVLEVFNGRTASGWASDADTAGPIAVHFYLDGDAATGTMIGSVMADVARGDVGPHGFSFSIPAPYRDGGSHTLYAYAINDGAGGNTLLSGSPKLTLDGTETWIAKPGAWELGTSDQWATVRANVDVIGLFVDQVSNAPLSQLRALAECSRKYGLKIGVEAAGIADWHAYDGTPAGTLAGENSAAEEIDKVRRFTDPVKPDGSGGAGGVIHYLNLDGPDRRYLYPNNVTRPDFDSDAFARELADASRVWQQTFPGLRVNYVCNFPNWGWKGGPAYNNFGFTAGAAGYGDVYPLFLKAISACQAAGYPLYGFTFDSPWEYVNGAHSSNQPAQISGVNWLARLRDAEHEVQSRGMKMTVYFNSEHGGEVNSVTNVPGSDQLYNDGVLAYIQAMQSAGSNVAGYALETWYRHPRPTVPETLDYSMANHVLRALAYTKGGPLNAIGSPAGQVLEASWTRIKGWAGDPDTAAPVIIHFYLGAPADQGGIYAGAALASQTRTDALGVNGAQVLNNAFTGYLDPATVAASSTATSTTLYVYALNAAGTGNSRLLQNCPVLLPPRPSDALGEVTTITQTTVHGWSYDPDDPGVANDVHFYRDGPFTTWVGLATANQPHPSVGNHGFTLAVPVDAQGRSLYAYGLNAAGAGTFTRLTGTPAVAANPTPTPTPLPIFPEPARTVGVAESEGTSSTTSTEWVEKCVLTLAPAQGTYLLLSSAELAGSSTGAFVGAQVDLDGRSWAPLTEYLTRPVQANQFETHACAKLMHLDRRTHTLRMVFRSSDTLATAQIRRARLMAIPVSGSYHMAEGYYETTADTSEDWFAETTFHVETPGPWLLLGCGQFKPGDTANSMWTRLKLDDVTQDEDLREGTNIDSTYPFMAMRVVNLTAGSHSLTLTGQTESGFRTIRQPRVIAVSLAGLDYQYAEAEAQASTNSTAFQVVTTLPLAAPSGGADGWAVLSTARTQGSSTAQDREVRLDLGGSVIGQQKLRPKDGTDYASFGTAQVLPGASGTLSLAHRSASAVATSRIRNARVLALPVATTPRPQPAHWSFNNDALTDGWIVGGTVSTVSAAASALTIESVGVDPLMISQQVAFAAEEYPWLRLRLRNGSNSNAAQFFWGTDDYPAIDGSRMVTIPILPNDTQIRDYDLHLGGQPLWTGTIRQVRLDPGFAAGTLDVDLLEFNAGLVPVELSSFSME